MKPRRGGSIAVLYLALGWLPIYVSCRAAFLILQELSALERALSCVVFLGETFFLTIALGYFLCAIAKLAPEPPSENEHIDVWPTIAIALCSYNEPLEVLEKTLQGFASISYPNKQLYFLDDTPYEGAETTQDYRQTVDALCRSYQVNLFRRRWHHAKAGLLNDFVAHLQGHAKPGSILIPCSKESPRVSYLLVLDADMKPSGSPLEPLVAMLERRSHLAFVQTTQRYADDTLHPVASGAAAQERLLNDLLLPGAARQGCAVCTGSNVLYRIVALTEVGGFDETSALEDISLSFQLHLKGWKTAWHSSIIAIGQAPATLHAYFVQQGRWGLGAIRLLWTHIVPSLLHHPRRLSLSQWTTYVTAGTAYLAGWAFLAWMTGPISYLLLGLQSYPFPEPWQAIFFLPSLVLMIAGFLAPLRIQGQRLAGIVWGVCLAAVAFPVFIRSSLLALKKGPASFQRTPKGPTRLLSWTSLWPQIASLIVCFSATVSGFYRLSTGDPAPLLTTFMTLWSLGLTALLVPLICFRNDSIPIHVDTSTKHVKKEEFHRYRT